MTDLQLLDAVLNASSVRKVVENGREYFVAPISLIVPGVLPGSKGSLYYPESEVKKNPGIWNNVPIVVYHPTDPLSGIPLSAKEPGVIARSGIGVLRNDRWENGKRVADGYIDAERVKKVDRRVYDVLFRNGQMETSTGLYTKNLQALRNSHYNGRQYHSIATEYRTDHLAILPDQVGACSLNDGCGLNVNTRNNTLSIIDEILANADDGRWITTSTGAKVFIKEGQDVGEAIKERFASKHNPEVTYGNKEDRDSDDKHFDKEIRRTAADVVKAKGELASKLEEGEEKQKHISDLKDKLSDVDKRIGEGKAAQQSAKDRIADLRKQLAESKKRSKALTKNTIDDVLIDVLLENANPDGCNQHTGPGCGGGSDRAEGATRTVKTLLSGFKPSPEAFTQLSKDLRSMTVKDKKQLIKDFKVKVKGKNKEDHVRALQDLVASRPEAEQAKPLKIERTNFNLEAKSSAWGDIKSAFKELFGKKKDPITGNAAIPVLSPDEFLEAYVDLHDMGDEEGANRLAELLEDYDMGVIDNANPEGCNQHTGPGCGNGGESKGDDVSGHMSNDEQSARKALADWTKSDERTTLRLTKGDKAIQEKEGQLRSEVHKHLAMRLANKIASAPPLDRPRKVLDATNVGDYIADNNGRIGVVVKTAQYDQGTTYRPPKKIGEENGVRWVDTGKTETTAQMKNDTMLTPLGVSASTSRATPNTNQGRQLETGQFLNKTGIGVKQSTTAAKKGFADLDGEQHTEEIDDVLTEIDDEVIEEVTNLRGDTMQLRSDQREAAVTYLVTNCDCWKGKEKVVNAFDDTTLIDIVRDVRNKHEDTIIANSVKSGVKVGNEMIKYDPETKTLTKNACGHEETPAPVTTKPNAEVVEEEDRTPEALIAPKKKAPPVPTGNAMTDEQFNQLCINQFGHPANIVKAGMSTVMQLEQTKRQNLVKRLVANVYDVEQKKALATNLLKKDTGELEMMTQLLPPVQQTHNRREEAPNLNFLGIGGGPVPGAERVDNADEDTLDTPTINWGEMDCVSNALRTRVKNN